MTTSPAAGATHTDAEIGNRITNAILVKSTNIHAVSDATGISYPTLRRSLKGGRSLTIRELTAIAEALNIRPSMLLPDTLTHQEAA